MLTNIVTQIVRLMYEKKLFGDPLVIFFINRTVCLIGNEIPRPYDLNHQRCFGNVDKYCDSNFIIYQSHSAIDV